MSTDYFMNPLQGEFFHNFRGLIMGRVSLFTIIEDTFSYTSKEHVVTQIPWK